MIRLILLIILLMATGAQASTYYVSTTGSDSNDGSINSPWLTPVYGASRLSAGDTLLIRGGAYQVTTTGANGQSAAIVPAANGCTIAAYPNESAVLVGNGGVMPTNGVIGDFNGTNKRDNTTIDGLTIKGIVVLEATGSVLKNCDVSVGGDSWSGIGQGEVVWIQGCVNCSVQNNRLHDNSLRGVQYTNSALVMAYIASGLVIENNSIYSSGGPGITLKDSQTNTVVRKNHIYDNAYGGVWTANQANAGTSTGTQIYQNIFANNNTANHAEYGAITFVTLATDLKIYNNTFYNNHVGDFNKWTGNAMAAEWFNNLHVSPLNNFQTWPYSGATYTFTFSDYNGYYSASPKWNYHGTTYSSLSAWQSYCGANLLTGCEANAVTTNPSFLNASGTYSAPADFKRSAYTANGRGGAYPSVMGAYVTGDEVIGYSGTVAPTTHRSLIGRLSGRIR